MAWKARYKHYNSRSHRMRGLKLRGMALDKLESPARNVLENQCSRPNHHDFNAQFWQHAELLYLLETSGKRAFESAG